MPEASQNLIVSYSADESPMPFQADSVEDRRIQWRRIEDGNSILKSWLLVGNGLIVEILGSKGILEIKPEALDELPRIFDQLIEAVGCTFSVGVAHDIEHAEKAQVIAEGRGGDRQILWTDEYAKELKALMEKKGKKDDDFNIYGQRLGKTLDDTWTAEEHEELFKLTGSTLEELLNKGAMNRIAPFNPQDPKHRLHERDEAAIARWQGPDREPEDRDVAVMNEGSPAMTRALHALHAATAVKRHPETGERMFLLHRGVSPEEHEHITSFGPDIYNHDPSTSSWTPNYGTARQFAKEYKYNTGGPTVVSAWVPESSISVIPKQFGELDDRADLADDEENYKFPKGANPYGGEHEVVVSPGHNSLRASPDEIQAAIKPLTTLHGRINEAGRKGEIYNSTRTPTIAPRETLHRLRHRKLGKAEDLAPEEQGALEGDEQPQSHEDKFHQHAKDNQAQEQVKQSPKVVHLKQAIVQILQQVKPQLHQLEALKGQDPDSHAAILAVLQSMVEMGKALTGNEPSQSQQQQDAQQGQPELSKEAMTEHHHIGKDTKTPVGTVVDGKIKVNNPETGKDQWRSARSGLVADDQGQPTSARNA